MLDKIYLVQPYKLVENEEFIILESVKGQRYRIPSRFQRKLKVCVEHKLPLFLRIPIDQFNGDHIAATPTYGTDNNMYNISDDKLKIEEKHEVNLKIRSMKIRNQQQYWGKEKGDKKPKRLPF